jgi:hypothetical protein
MKNTITILIDPNQVEYAAVYARLKMVILI